jgi:hypothetical protein
VRLRLGNKSLSAKTQLGHDGMELEKEKKKLKLTLRLWKDAVEE